MIRTMLLKSLLGLGLGLGLGLCVSSIYSAALLAADAPSASVPKLQLTSLLSGLDRPVYLTNHGTPEIYIIEQPGIVRVWENGKLRQTPFLDISGKANVDYECGLLSIAFHPKFAENGLVYAYYTINLPPIKSVI